MIDKNKPVCLVLKDTKEVDLITYCLVSNGIKRITSFVSAKEAYEVAIRQQFSLFVTRVEMEDMNGLVLIQKLRETGNYGLETHLLICDHLDPPKLSILYEYDLPYVVTPPYQKPAIIEKIKHLVQKENELPELEQQFRDARAAYSSNMLDMCEYMLIEVLKKAPDLEKAQTLKGDLAMKRKLYDDAEKCYEQALKTNPKSSVASSKLASCYLAKGLFQQAANIFNHLAEMNQYNIKLLESAGLSNVKVDDFANAEKHIKLLTKVDEKNTKASTLQVDIKIKKGDYDGLADILSKTHSDVEIVRYLNSAGITLSKEKDPDCALKMYEACLNQVPNSKYLYAIYYNMGLAYKMKKDNAMAKKYFERSILLKPDFEKAITALQGVS